MVWDECTNQNGFELKHKIDRGGGNKVVNMIKSRRNYIIEQL